MNSQPKNPVILIPARCNILPNYVLELRFPPLARPVIRTENGPAELAYRGLYTKVLSQRDRQTRAVILEILFYTETTFARPPGR
jgi:hypothetical protein